MSISRALLRAARTLATFVLLASAAACGGNGEVDLPDPAPPRTLPAETPPPDLTAEEQQAVDEVRALVDEFLTAYVEILTAGNPPTDAEIEPFLRLLTSPLITQAEEVYDNYQSERRADGRVDWEFVDVVEADLENVGSLAGEDVIIPLVQLRYCVDGTEWQTVDKNTGAPVGPAQQRVVEQGQRNHVTVEAAYYDSESVAGDARWLLRDWTNEEGQPC